MAGNQEKWKAFKPFFTVVWSFFLASVFVSAERKLKLQEFLSHNGNATSYNVSDSITDFKDSVLQANKSSYQHVWPDLNFMSWQLIVGSIFGFFGAAFGSQGGAGGGGLFVPMLILIIGFDPKSAIAISNCMITGAAISTVYYNLKLRHPTLNMPIIDYDLALLIQPMLLLGISIGVIFNLIFADWMLTLLLMIIFLGTSTKALLKGVETWMKESVVKKEAVKRLKTSGNGNNEAEYEALSGCPPNGTRKKANDLKEPEVGVFENVRWKEFGLLVFVWIAFLSLQIIKNYTTTCSSTYWVVNLLQILVSFIVSGFEGISVYKGRRIIESKGDGGVNLKVEQLITCCFFGILAGIVGGIVGLGGGFIICPLLLELGVPPQVSSATSTFVMMFSSSLSMLENYLLQRFPIPYALYFSTIATVAAFIGHHVVRKLIIVTRRASSIIFVLAFTIFISALSLGGVGTSNMIEKIQRNEYMGFENLCMKYQV